MINVPDMDIDGVADDNIIKWMNNVKKLLEKTMLLELELKGYFPDFIGFEMKFKEKPAQ